MDNKLSSSQIRATAAPTNIGGGKAVGSQLRKGQRIEYIDALRGFTMILVVMTHVCSFCFNSYNLSYSSIMAQFRMPLFFFVSGFVFYKDIIWDRYTFASFMKKKIPVQILTPTIFLLLYIYIKQRPIKGILYDEFRYGYWFTYVLFLFFVFYIIIKLISQSLKIKSKWNNVILILWGCICYTVTLIGDVFLKNDLSGLLLMGHWRLFIFFVAGAMSKQYFNYFQKLLDNKYAMLFIIAFYFLSNIFDKYVFGYHGTIDIPLSLLRNFSGVFIVFAFFRKYSAIFTKDKWLGRSLQYIGRRTLDIYLLHYFFLPSGLVSVFTLFADNELPTLEIFASMLLSLLVISLCLIVSNVYRLSPWIEEKMFGVKKKKVG